MAAGDLPLAVERFCDWTAFPGAFGTLPPALQAMFRDNARTLPLHMASPPPTVTPEDLGRLRLPVTYTLGELSPEFFQVLTHAALRATPDAQLQRLARAHHGGPFECVERFNALVLDHLDRATHRVTRTRHDAT